MTTEDMVSLGWAGPGEGSATSSALPAGLVSHKTREAATNNWDKIPLGLQALSGDPVHQSSCKLHAVCGLRR